MSEHVTEAVDLEHEDHGETAAVEVTLCEAREMLVDAGLASPDSVSRWFGPF